MKKHLAICIVSAATMVGGLGVTSRADVIANYSFSSAGDLTSAASAVSGATPGNIVEGAGLATANGKFNVGVDSSGAAMSYGGNLILETGYKGTTATSPTEGGGFSFTVAVDPLTPVNLSSLAFDVALGGTSASRGFFITSSLTGDTQLASYVVDGSASNITLDSTANLRPNLAHQSIDLTSNAAFQNVTGDVTFSIYLVATSANRTFDFDNITLNGAAAAVPEPASLAVLGLGVAALAGSRRREQV